MTEMVLPAGAAAPATAHAGVDEVGYWRALLGQVGAQVAGPLTEALNRVDALVASGRIDRQGLRALHAAVSEARRVAMLGQQVARYASGRLRQSHERLDLTQMLREALRARSGETQLRGLQLHQVLKPAEVIVDASLLFGLLNAVLDWALPQARSTVTLRLDHKAWPAHARLRCSFVHRPPDEVDDAQAPVHVEALDTLAWRLTQQLAATMGLPLERLDTASACTLTLEFPRTVNEVLEGVSAVEIDPDFSPSSLDSKPLAGSHVLVLAGRRDVRAAVRDAIRHMGLIIDFVGSLDEAAAFCRDGLPHAVVYDATIGGPAFEAWRAELGTLAAELVFIEIDESSDAFEVSGFGGRGTTRVGRRALATGLPSALAFELSKNIAV